MLISRSDRGLVAKWWFTVDRGLLAAVFLLMAAGVLFSMAASPSVALRIGLEPFFFFKRQLFFLAPAVAVLMVTSLLNERQARRASLLAYVVSVALMAAAIAVGPEIKGAHRWVDVGPFNLQPSEFAKPALVVMVAWFLAEGRTRREIPGQIIAWVLFATVLAILARQPDFGQAVLVVLLFATLLMVHGIPWVVVIGLGGMAVGGLVAAYRVLPHVASRIDRFLNPDSGDTFQVDTAIQAFRNGGALGTGPGGGIAKNSLPDSHTDFVFAVIGEEFGLVACLTVIGLFAFIVLRVLRQAKREDDPFIALALTGLVSIFALQAIINMAVNASLLPAKGMTLPFISYGGSSLIAMAFAMGLILALGRRKPQARMPVGQLGHSAG
jgi:cell division protein FtsW